MKDNIQIKNKRARHEFYLEEFMTAGIVLLGTEIKSIREGKASITDAYCAFQNNELYVKEMHIAEYSHRGFTNHETKRDRKLLLQYRELKKLRTKTKEKGFTIVPTMLFVNDKGLAKLEIALAKGKHYYDKRETLKLKDSKREMDRLKKI
ncbi:MAG: SsrA-binding protein SmpB [Bacteroidales bacterium]|nr:SsrA-binding protein SmpB [Bacteroidales bacterium]